MKVIVDRNRGDKKSGAPECATVKTNELFVRCQLLLSGYCCNSKYPRDNWSASF